MPVMDFDYFVVGATVGRRTVDLALLARDWAALFPEAFDPDAGEAPPALVAAAMMRGYTMILDERVPGNVHASQTLRWGKPASLSASVTVLLSCADKSFRDGRRWIVFDIAVESATGEPHLQGEMRFLWAA